MKKVYTINKAPRALGPYSHATEAAGLFFLSGQLGIDPSTNELVVGGVVEETKQVMENIAVILEDLGLNFSDVVKSTIFFTDIKDFSRINEIYGSYFSANFPSRSAVEVSAIAKGAKVEIEMVVTAR
ncbi:MAG: Rid family detoxifying hydrolase [Rickettsiales bacterium]|jgi:2-iminobutanoate/2-iminopropanoate deaminase|nr:Rid family detoxifying hydrolase [Rickettsiales bacterium]